MRMAVWCVWRAYRTRRAAPLPHDVYLKIAQLDGVHLGRYHVILLDEAQDCTDCQLDLFVTQQGHAARYVVGDLAQRLYTFRGVQVRTRESNTVGLTALLGSGRPLTKRFELTRSFRFGENIARVANAMLWVKRNCNLREVSVGYERIRGCGPVPGVVLPEGECMAYPKTVIGRTNEGLFIEAIKLLGIDYSDTYEERMVYRANAPKIAILGDSSTAGLARFKALVNKEIPDAYRLYMNLRPLHKPFSDYKTWGEFTDTVEKEEKNEYKIIINIIQRYGGWSPQRLQDVLDIFEQGVLRQTLDPTQCDVLLTTVHQAKGLEWPRVELADDFVGLAEKFTSASEKDMILTNQYRPMRMRKRVLNLQTYDKDSVNLWYVAVTRAREELALPSSWWKLIREFKRGSKLLEDWLTARKVEPGVQREIALKCCQLRGNLRDALLLARLDVECDGALQYVVSMDNSAVDSGSMSIEDDRGVEVDEGSTTLDDSGLAFEILTPQNKEGRKAYIGEDYEDRSSDYPPRKVPRLY